MPDPKPKPLTKEEVLAKLKAGKTLRDLEIGDINFQDHFFEYTPDFSGAIFTGITDFSGAQFSNGANFMSAKFFGEGGVYFIGSQFSGENGVSFIFTEFSSEAGTHFNEATFSSRGKTEFNAAKFFGKGDNKFHMTKFFCEGGVDFSGAQFLGPGKTSFSKTVFGQHASAWFEGTKSDPPWTLEFVDVSTLGNALFLYSNLEMVIFKDVRFLQIQNRFFNREYLADEVRNEIVTDGDTAVYNRDYYRQVEILYRQLKVNFENQRDYARAGDFHYGEMEMLRKWKMLEYFDAARYSSKV
jgi:uncharacterized protein YjbI with pentapeptide repeats